jgi:hypothetical protein
MHARPDRTRGGSALFREVEQTLKKILDFTKLLCVLTRFVYDDLDSILYNLGEREGELYNRITKITFKDGVENLYLRHYFNVKVINRDIRLFNTLAKSLDGFVVDELKKLFKVRRLERYKYFDDLEPYLEIALDRDIMKRFGPTIRYYQTVKEIDRELPIEDRIVKVQDTFYEHFRASDLLKKLFFDYFRNKWEMYSQWDETFLNAAYRLNDVIDLFHNSYNQFINELDIVDWQFIDSMLEQHSAEINEAKRKYIREIVKPKIIKK